MGFGRPCAAVPAVLRAVVPLAHGGQRWFDHHGGSTARSTAKWSFRWPCAVLPATWAVVPLSKFQMHSQRAALTTAQKAPAVVPPGAAVLPLAREKGLQRPEIGRAI